MYIHSYVHIAHSIWIRSDSKPSKVLLSFFFKRLTLHTTWVASFSSGDSRIVMKKTLDRPAARHILIITLATVSPELVFRRGSGERKRAMVVIVGKRGGGVHNNENHNDLTSKHLTACMPIVVSQCKHPTYVSSCFDCDGYGKSSSWNPNLALPLPLNLPLLLPQTQ